MQIFLIGMPGCGKSTFGKKVAFSLNLPFFDLDHEIVNREGISISDIFENKGEEYFRKVETTLLHEITLSNTSFIMATGGGAPCFFDNMDFMNENGITIYIEADINHLLSRLSEKGIEKRPLLKQIGKKNLKQGLEDKLNYRKLFYHKASVILPYRESLELDIIRALQN